jgi:serine protease Do
MPDNFPTQADSLLDRYRRARNRAILLSVASSALALGVLAGVWLSSTKRYVIASNGEIMVEMSSAFVEIARKVEPAVVNISTVIQPAIRASRRESFAEERPLLEQFGGRERARRGNGSGFVVDPQGYILTNQHVVAEADRIIVKFYDGSELPGRVVGADSETDLAVVKVDPLNQLAAARLGDSEKARVGDWVMAIGSPFNLSQTVTAGIISAKDREAVELNKKAARGFQYFLQTDAAINPGNSGGPLINLAGEVIGINTAIATATGDYNGIGFALPANEAQHVYLQLVRQGRVVRGFLGVITDPVTAQVAKVYGLPAARGAIISNINETVNVNGLDVASPGAKAGLRLNDVIVEYRGERIRDDKDLVRRIGSTPAGSSAALKIYRDGREMLLTVTVGRRPGADLPPEIEPVSMRGGVAAAQPIGISVSDLTGQLGIGRTINNVRGALVANVTTGSVAEDAGVRSGDVIESFNRETIRTRADFLRVLNRLRPGEPVVLQVYRDRWEPNPRLFVSFNKP